MPDYNKTKIQIYDGDSTELTFMFNNVTRATNRQGGVYYQFQCEEGRFTCNNHCVRAIQQAWPGRGGIMHISKKDDSTYIISDVVMGDGGELGMQSWAGNGFAQIPFDLDGLGEAAPVDKPPAQNSNIEPATTTAVTNEGETLDDLCSLMSDCLKESMAMWANSIPDQVEIGGDVAGAIERISVSLYIDCRKAGITGKPSLDDWPSKPEMEEGQVRVRVEGGEPVEVPRPLGDNGPGEDEDDLPF
tara:strand:+ start:4617 stop:5351 length:735 start_codon:yes stop_codon:yes gene_type:complete